MLFTLAAPKWPSVVYKKTCNKNMIAYAKFNHTSFTWCFYFRCAMSHIWLLCTLVFIRCWYWNTHFLNKQWEVVRIFLLTWFTAIIYRFTSLFVTMSRANIPWATPCLTDCTTQLLPWEISWTTHCLVTESSMSKLPHTLAASVV